MNERLLPDAIVTAIVIAFVAAIFTKRKSQIPKIFCSGQYTIALAAQLNQIGLKSEVCLAMPSFNKSRQEQSLLSHYKTYNVPVFGLRIPKALMPLFDLGGMRELAHTLGIKLPRYDISSFIQNKMYKVRTLIVEVRKRADCQADQNATAVDRLERFVDDFANLCASDIADLEAWDKWVCARTDPNWKDNLHFDNLLSNFGFDEQVAQALQETKIENPQDDGTITMVSLEQYSLRWLSKAFAGFNVVGCLTDVVNLLYAMDGEPPNATPLEADIVDTIERVVEKILGNNWSGLWIPTHMIHDAETDDQLAWLLLRYIHACKDTQLNVLVQLPDRSKHHMLKEIHEYFVVNGCQTFSDDKSRNLRAIIAAFGKA